MSNSPPRSHWPSAPFLIAAAGILLAASRLAAGSFQWTSHGPWGGPLSAVASCPSQPQVLYAGSPYGNIFRSLDGGQTWETRHHVLFAYVSALAVSPSNPDTVYAVGDFGFRRSFDGGESWGISFDGGGSGVSNVGSGSRVLAIDPASPNVLYVAGSYGEQSYISRSSNGGDSWEDVTHGLTSFGINAIVIRTGPEPDVLVGTTGGIFRSTDSGASWNPSDDGLTDLYVQTLVGDPANPSVLFAGTGTAGVFKSVDGGGSWSPSNAGLPGLNVYAMLVAPGAAFAAVSSLGIQRSTDGGAHWTAADSGVPEPVLVNAFALGGANQGLFAGTPRGLYRTGDLGASWATSQEGLAGNSANNVTVSPSSSLLAASASTGLFLSSDDGRTWTDPGSVGLGTGSVPRINTAAFDPQDESTMYASLNECCGVYKTTDGGLHWALTRELDGPTWELIVDPTDSATAYAGTPSTPYKTQDGGGFWQSMHEGIPQTLSLDALEMDPNNPNILFAATSAEAGPDPASGMYRSTDGAATWERSSDGLDGFWTLEIAVAPSDSQRVYASSGFVSTDGGSTWNSMDGGGYTVAVDPTDALTVYAGGIEGVSRSRDGGATWQDMSVGLPTITVAAVYSLAVGPGGSVLHAATTRGVFSYSFSFDDVLPGDPFYEAVRVLALNLLTTGCGNGNFCPLGPMTRAQAAVLLLRTKHGSEFQPPQATGTLFSDVPADAFAAAWIEQLAAEGITSGCGGGAFCPDAALTRAEAAVLLLRAKHGPDYTPRPPRERSSPTYPSMPSRRPGLRHSPPRGSRRAAAEETSVRANRSRGRRPRRCSCGLSTSPSGTARSGPAPSWPSRPACSAATGPASARRGVGRSGAPSCSSPGRPTPSGSPCAGRPRVRAQP